MVMDQVMCGRTVDLVIGGMTCASCVSRVERVLGRVPGVVGVSVNLATELARVEVGPGVGADAMISAVLGAGYSASLLGGGMRQSGGWEVWQLSAAFLFSAPLLVGMILPVPGWLAFMLATMVQFWLGARFYRAAWGSLRAGMGNMDLLVALGTSAAYFLSAWDFWVGGPLYFESSAVVITLVRLGRFLEGRAKREAVGAVAGLARLRPVVAHRGGRDVAVGDLRVGDVIDVRVGERVPMDGVVVGGCGRFDESHLTGEVLPVLRGVGAAVLAGALNLDGVVGLRVTSAQGESFLDRVGRLIEGAQASKPAVQALADRVAAVFVPVVVGVALVTFLGWLWLGVGVGHAVIHAVSVLVIACPCALGLATPAAILAGTGVAARHGILMKNAQAIERAAGVDMVVFDKTGTLTLGRLVLAEVRVFGGVSRDDVLRIAAALAAGDSHAVAGALRVEGVAAAEGLKNLVGRGIEGRVAGVRYLLGSARLVDEAGGVAPVEGSGGTVSYLSKADGEVLAAFGFTDEVRGGAKAAVARLVGMGIGVKMLSGDCVVAAEAVGRAVGILDVVGGALPEEKVRVVGELGAAGRVVAMVGDGVNDAAALAAAAVGMAMGSGADAAIESADFALLRVEPGLVVDALLLSKRIWRTLKQGLFWAVIYNVVGIALAALGYLSPVVAGGAMAASSVCVLGNALRLRRWRPG